MEREEYQKRVREIMYVKRQEETNLLVSNRQ